MLTHMWEWLYLPRDLEARFAGDESVLRTLTVSDVLAHAVTVLLHWRFMRLFHVLSAATMASAQRLTVVVCWCTSVLQLAWIAAAPQHYRRHRHRATMANRLLRLGFMALTLAQITPAVTRRQMQAYYDATSTNLKAAQQQQQHGGGSACDEACREMIKALVIPPTAHLFPSYFVVAFAQALPLQAATFLLSLAMEGRRVCTQVQGRVAGATVPSSAACRHISEAARVAGQLATWDPPASAAQVQGGSDALCADPLAALLLLKLWVHFMLLFALPLALGCGLEASLKAKFVASSQGRRLLPAGPPPGRTPAASAADGAAAPAAAAAAVAAPGALQQGGPAAAHAVAAGSSQGGGGGGGASPAPAPAAGPWQAQGDAPHGARREQQPLPRQLGAPLPLPAAGGAAAPSATFGWVNSSLFLVVVLTCAAALSWFAAELVMVAFMRAGARRSFECDADGWLQVAVAPA